MPRHEAVGVALVIGFIIGLTLVPYVYGWATCPEGKHFLGLIGQNGGDLAFYLGWGPKQAEHGHLLFEDKYNGYADRRPVFNPLWLAMGWLARLTGVSIFTTFHVERVAFSVLLLLTSYGLIRHFVETVPWRLVALAAVGLSSGFGAWLVPFRDWSSPRGIFSIPPTSWTPDLWIVESNTFLIMLWEVVLPCAAWLFLLTLWAGFRTLFQDSGSATRTGFLALALGTVYPYAVVSVYLILGAGALLRVTSGRGLGRTVREYATLVLISLPIVLYDGYLVVTDPKLTTGQAGYLSPGLWRYLLSFGVVGLLSVFGIWLAARRRSPEDKFLLVWIGVTFVQIYIPVSLVAFQMQLILGVQLALVILAVRPLSMAWTALAAVRPRLLSRAILVALALVMTALATATSAYHLNNVFVSLQRRALPEYMDRNLEEAIQWMAAHTREDAVVLSSPEVAPYIPVIANNRMFSGNYEAPTADFPAKLAKIEWLVRSEVAKTDTEIEKFLQENRIDYVFYDEYLARLGGDVTRARLDATPGLALAFRSAAVSIYEVRR
jgi:hypothetical protein